MLDRNRSIDRLVEAALKLAETKPWRSISMMDIAREAGLTLLDVKELVSGKDDLVTAFSRLVDDEVLRRSQPQAGALDDREPARDRLFGVIMNRFDVLLPYRAALKSILADANAGTAALALGRVLNSQRWMLTAAGIDADGVGGAMRATGLAGVYADAFRTWLDDDDPGMAKTMAVLDRRLRNGERWMRAMSDMSDGLRRMRETMRGGMRGMRDFDPRKWRDARRGGSERGDSERATSNGSTMI